MHDEQINQCLPHQQHTHTYTRLTNARGFLSILQETNVLKFLINRLDKLQCNSSDDDDNRFYFRYLAYELLYLWSALGSMRQCDLQTIYEGIEYIQID